MGIKWRKPSPALLVAVVALVAALAGTAIGGVVNKALTGQEQQQVKKIAKRLDKKIALTPGPLGPQGEQGLQGIQGLQGPAGSARAYGFVSSAGVLTRSKNVSGVVRLGPGTGIYCITPDPSINISQAVLMLQVIRSSDSSLSDGGENIPVASWVPNPTDLSCPVDTMAVRTFLYDGDAIDDDDGGGNTVGDNLIVDDEPFAFAIP